MNSDESLNLRFLERIVENDSCMRSLQSFTRWSHAISAFGLGTRRANSNSKIIQASFFRRSPPRVSRSAAILGCRTTCLGERPRISFFGKDLTQEIIAWQISMKGKIYNGIHVQQSKTYVISKHYESVIFVCRYAWQSVKGAVLWKHTFGRSKCWGRDSITIHLRFSSLFVIPLSFFVIFIAIITPHFW